MCCSPCDLKESDTTERLNNNNNMVQQRPRAAKKKKDKHSKTKSSFIFQTKKEYKNSKPSNHKIYVSAGIEEEETFRQTRRLFLRREGRKARRKKAGMEEAIEKISGFNY